MKDFRLDCFCFLLSGISKNICTCSVTTLYLEYFRSTYEINILEEIKYLCQFVA